MLAFFRFSLSSCPPDFIFALRKAMEDTTQLQFLWYSMVVEFKELSGLAIPGPFDPFLFTRAML
jgi:hypothetical protein